MQVHIFLSGFDSKFEQVCGEILRKDLKLDLETTYIYVRREYQQKQTMNKSHPSMESSTMVAQKNFKNWAPTNKNNFVFAHYGESGQSKLLFYEIVGYPNWWDFSKKPRKNISGKTLVALKEEDKKVHLKLMLPTQLLMVIFLHSL